MNKISPAPSVTKEQLKAVQFAIQAGMKLSDVASKYQISIDTINYFISSEGEFRESGLRMMLNF
ncbi:hypothetical protein ACR9PT_10305 [Piscirickettsia salmonis]|uniref:hypothetical protein n=1 Tax=Piscirickettsia salmonis TaxID=1238 RepID=UPI003EBFD034